MELHSESSQNIFFEYLSFFFSCKKIYVLSLNETVENHSFFYPRAFLFFTKWRNKNWLLSRSVISVAHDNPIRAKPNGIYGLRCTSVLRKMSTCENRRLRICILKCSTSMCRVAIGLKYKHRTQFDVWITHRDAGIFMQKK